MKFFKLLKNDIKNGFAGTAMSYIIVAVIVLVSSIDLTVRVQNAYRYVSDAPVATYLDYACYLLGGIPKYIPSPTSGFVFPVKWFLLHMYLLYITLYYPYRDVNSLGISVLPRCGSRTAWWLSKCVWNVLRQMVAYIVIFVTLLICCLLSGGELSLKVNSRIINDIMQAGSYYEEYSCWLPAVVLILPVLYTICSSLLQMALTLFVKPIFSFGILAVLMIAAAYSPAPFLLGNYAMAIRSIYIVEEGFRMEWGIAGMVICMALAVIAGAVRFRKFDILNRE